jgi:hypothetical protein
MDSPHEIIVDGLDQRHYCKDCFEYFFPSTQDLNTPEVSE